MTTTMSKFLQHPMQDCLLRQILFSGREVRRYEASALSFYSSTDFYGSMESIPCKTESEKNDLFGYGLRRDLIQMRGPRGRDLYTNAIIQSIRASGLSIKT